MKPVNQKNWLLPGKSASKLNEVFLLSLQHASAGFIFLYIIYMIKFYFYYTFYFHFHFLDLYYIFPNQNEIFCPLQNKSKRRNIKCRKHLIWINWWRWRRWEEAVLGCFECRVSKGPRLPVRTIIQKLEVKEYTIKKDERKRLGRYQVWGLYTYIIESTLTGTVLGSGTVKF